MRSGTKSDFMQSILQQADVQQPKKLAESDLPTVFVIDAMAFVQRYQTLGAKTFADLMTQYRQKIFQLKPINCADIHLVGDRYDFDPASSIKLDERKRRGSSNLLSKEYILSDNLEIPDWRAFLNNPCNKTNLLQYMTTNLCQGNLPGDIEITFGGTSRDRDAISVTNAATKIVPEHEE